jgi:hypothetical protein
MFLSKIWFILVGLLAGIAVTAAFVAPRPADRRIEQLEGQRMDRAQYAAEQLLKNDARRWIDYVAKLGTDGKLIDALDAASRGASELRPLHESVRNRLRDLVPIARASAPNRLLPSMARAGWWRAWATTKANSASPSQEPKWSRTRCAAIFPTTFGGQATASAALARRRCCPSPTTASSGALVVTVETGKRLAEMWKRNLGVDVAIVLGKTVLYSTLPEALLTQLPQVIEEHAAEITSHKRTRALPLSMGNERILTVAAPFSGEAALQRAYYVLLTKKSPESDPWALLSSTSSDDLKWGNFPWLSLAGGLLAIIGIGLFLQRYGGRRRPCKPPARRSACHGQAGAGAQDRRHEVRRKVWVESPATSTPPSSTSRMRHCPRVKQPRRIFLLFSIRAPSLRTASRTMSPASPLQNPLFRRQLPWPPRCSERPDRFLDCQGNRRPCRHPWLPRSPHPSWPSPPPQPSPPPPPSRSFAPSPPAARPAQATPGEDPDYAHYKQVFEEYLALRQNCGESVVGLSLEKFVAKLQSNRDQLTSKHGCKTAHFTVYEKDGKAAIRAVPVRE